MKFLGNVVFNKWSCYYTSSNWSAKGYREIRKQRYFCGSSKFKEKNNTEYVQKLLLAIKNDSLHSMQHDKY